MRELEEAQAELAEVNEALDAVIAANERVRALALQWISKKPENVSESAVRVILAEAGSQIIAALDGAS